MDFVSTAFIALGVFCSFYGSTFISKSKCKPSDEGPQSLHGRTTVIVGGGVIGLFTAYSLAKAYHQLQRRHRILVIEARDNLFSASSEHNSGCLAHHWLPGFLKPLGAYPYDLWRDLGKDIGFLEACGYKEDCLYEIRPDNGKNLHELPNWFISKDSWDVRPEAEPGDVASILVTVHSRLNRQD